MRHLKRAFGGLAAFTLAIALNGATQAQVDEPVQDTMAEGFAQPPASARPHGWWRWCNRNVSKEGITLDLEALKRLGIGRVLQSDIGYPHGPNGAVVYRSPEYWVMIRHAVTECQRLGLEFDMNDSPGWTPSGGPWISKENVMQKLDFARVTVQGPKLLEADLTRMYGEGYENVAILAFPTPAGALENLWSRSPKVTATVEGFNPTVLHDGDLNPYGKLVNLPKDGNILIELDKPTTFQSASFMARGTRRLVLEASDDGVAFRPLGGLQPESFTGHPLLLTSTIAFAPVTARWFRLRVTEGSTKLTEFDMNNAAVVHDLGARALWYTQYEMTPPPFADGKDAVIDPAKILDLSVHMKSVDRLAWQVPEGNWTVVRIGRGLVGGHCSPAEGIETRQCDKLSAAAVTEHFTGGVQTVFEKLGVERGGQTFTGMHMDSWEAGEANWTTGFEAEFKLRRGYDMKPYLLALAGHVVTSSDITERFLWDFRRTLGDLVVDNHYKLYHRLCKESGLLYEIQPYGGAGSPFDELRVARHCDRVQSEVWGGGGGYVYDLVDGIPSTAHVYGRKIVSTEAFTGAEASFEIDPFALKASGDYMFATGINQLMLADSPHQPWKESVAGVWDYPMYYHRGNTWFAHSGDWVKYLARCSFLLQEGEFVADLVYIYGEDTPLRLNPRKPKVPYGYAWDACPAEFAIEAMSVVAGKIALPSGMRYQALLLPPDERLTPELMRKVRELVQAGATVLGRKPSGSPTLMNYPARNDEVKKIAAELWSESTELGAERTVGKGRVINAWDIEQVNQVKQSFNFQANSRDMEAGLETILARLGWQPDVIPSVSPLRRNGNQWLRYLHRSTPDGSEVYFIANLPYQPISLDINFRVSGLRPQFWRPDTGERTLPEKWEEKDGRTTLKLDLDQAERTSTGPGYGSIFVDKDGAAYKIWGPGFVVRLNDDLSKVAENASKADLLSKVAGYPNAEWCARQFAPRAASLYLDGGDYLLVWSAMTDADGAKREDSFVATAKSLEGPYSEPRLLVAGSGPAVLFDGGAHGLMLACSMGNAPALIRLKREEGALVAQGLPVPASKKPAVQAKPKMFDYANSKPSGKWHEPYPKTGRSKLVPLFDLPLSDICIAKGGDDAWYLVGTAASQGADGQPDFENNDGLYLWKSSDMNTWTPLGKVWDIATDAAKNPKSAWQLPYRVPANNPTHTQFARGITSPEIRFAKGTFWIAYSMNGRGTGLLKSSSGKAEGPYEDVGRLTGMGGSPSLYVDEKQGAFWLWGDLRAAKLTEGFSALDGAAASLFLSLGPIGRAFDYWEVDAPHIFSAVNPKDTMRRPYLTWSAVTNRLGRALRETLIAVSTTDSPLGPYGTPRIMIPHGGQTSIFTSADGTMYASFYGADPMAVFRNRPAFVPILFATEYWAPSDAPVRIVHNFYTNRGSWEKMEPIVASGLIDYHMTSLPDGNLYVGGSFQGGKNAHLQGKVPIFRSSDPLKPNWETLILHTYEQIEKDPNWPVTEKPATNWTAGHKHPIAWITRLEFINGNYYLSFMMTALTPNKRMEPVWLKSTTGKPEGPYAFHSTEEPGAPVYTSEMRPRAHDFTEWCNDAGFVGVHEIDGRYLRMGLVEYGSYDQQWYWSDRTDGVYRRVCSLPYTGNGSLVEFKGRWYCSNQSFGFQNPTPTGAFMWPLHVDTKANPPVIEHEFEHDAGVREMSVYGK